MKTLTGFDIQQLKRQARRLSDENGISHSKALDLVADKQGHGNWSLLMKRHERDRRRVAHLLRFQIAPFPDGDEGVFIANLHIVEKRLREEIGDDRVFFGIPRKDGWIVRPATKPQLKMTPYLYLANGQMQGIMVEGTWTAIVSVNGGTRDEIRRRIVNELPSVSAELHAGAALAISRWLPALSGSIAFRLFWSQPQHNGTNTVEDDEYPTLEAAQLAKLPQGAIPIGISVGGLWCAYYQRGFGWQRNAEPPPNTESDLHLAVTEKQRLDERVLDRKADVMPSRSSDALAPGKERFMSGRKKPGVAVQYLKRRFTPPGKE